MDTSSIVLSVEMGQSWKTSLSVLMLASFARGPSASSRPWTRPSICSGQANSQSGKSVMQVGIPHSRRQSSRGCLHHGFRHDAKGLRSLAAGTPASTEQSDSRGQDGDTDLDEETTKSVGAHQKYLSRMRCISSAQVSSAQVRG